MNPFPLRCIIIEDEEDIREWLVDALKKFNELEIIGEATHIDEAYMLISTKNPDVVFLDVVFPKGDAFSLLSRLEKNNIQIPYIVMATGYTEYVMTALNEYRSYVVQYLVKPFIDGWEDKARKAIDALVAAKMKDSLEKTVFTSNENKPTGHTFIQNRGSFLKVDFQNLVYLEAAGGGESYLVLPNDTPKVDLTLKKILDLLPKEYFIRISKTNIINITKVLSINRGDRTVEMDIGQGKTKLVGISHLYYQKLLKKLPLAKDQLG